MRSRSRARVDEAKIRGGHILRQSAIKFCEDGLADGSTMLEDVVAPDAQDGKTLSPHEFVAATIIRAVSMLGTVEFDDQASFATGKVREVWADRELPCKFVPAKLASL